MQNKHRSKATVSNFRQLKEEDKRKRKRHGARSPSSSKERTALTRDRGEDADIVDMFDSAFLRDALGLRFAKPRLLLESEDDDDDDTPWYSSVSTP